MSNSAPAAGKKHPINTLWFQHRLRDLDRSQRALAHHLKLDPSAVSYMLKGHRRMQLHEAVAIADYIKVPLTDVLNHAGLPQKLAAVTAGGGVPVIGSITPDGRAVEAYPDDGEMPVAPQPGGALSNTLVAWRFDTALSGLAVCDGWLAYTVPASGVCPNVAGRLCVVLDVENVSSLAFVMRSLDSQYKLMNFATHELTTAGLQSAAPVLWLKC